METSQNTVDSGGIIVWGIGMPNARDGRLKRQRRDQVIAAKAKSLLPALAQKLETNLRAMRGNDARPKLALRQQWKDNSLSLGRGKFPRKTVRCSIEPDARAISIETTATSDLYAPTTEVDRRRVEISLNDRGEVLLSCEGKPLDLNNLADMLIEPFFPPC